MQGTFTAVSILLLSWATQGISRYLDEHRDAIIEDVPYSWVPNNYYWHRPIRNSRSEFSFSFDKRGYLGKVSFEVEVMLPYTYRTRNITHVDVKFAPDSNLDGEVYITKGGVGYDFATVHFESHADEGNMRAFITLDNR